MDKVAGDRRRSKRFNLRLTLRYRLSEKGGQQRWNTGVTRDISKDGVVFKTRHPLPVGAHLEMHFDWPARYAAIYPVDLQATGFVLRNDGGRTAVRISSHRFLVKLAAAAEPFRATA